MTRFKPFVFISFFVQITVIGCTKSIKFTPEHIAETSGRYLFNPDELMEVRYVDNHLFLKYKGVEKEPVILDENTIFVPDMYQKLRFMQEPNTKNRYLGIVSKDDENVVTYDYLKVADSFKTPSMYLEAKEFDKALEGFLKVKPQDSVNAIVNEYKFNRIGYDYLRKEEYDNAIAVFKMNVALYPDSDNVYDSLADAYLRSGDSLQALNNYTKALELNSGNQRAKKFIENYGKKED